MINVNATSTKLTVINGPKNQIIKVSSSGPAGPAGAASVVPGPPGATGPAGAAGVAGPTGVDGAPGLAGPAGAAGTTPIHILPGESYTVPANTQALYVRPIINDGILTVDGELIQVGELGATNDAHEVFTQSTPLSTWNVTHSLNKKPSATVVDSSGSQCFGDVQYLSNTALIISFSAAFSGQAFLN